MGIPLKIASTIGVLGTIGGGLAVANHFSSDTIKDRLEKVGYQLLDDKTTDTAKVLKAYKLAQTKDTLFGTINSEAELKNKCDEILAKKDEKNYSLASKWCVKEETIFEMLKRNKFTPIRGVEADGNNPKWQAKLDLLKKDTKNNDKIASAFKEASDIVALEKACTALIGLKTHSENEFEMKYINATKWCSEKVTNA